MATRLRYQPAESNNSYVPPTTPTAGLAPEEIAEILDTDELPVVANEPPTEISVGDD